MRAFFARPYGLAAAAVFLLSGCGPVALSGIPLVGQAEAISVVGSDKTIVDHVVSMSSGKNCSSVRREQGLHYCEEDEPTVNPEVYCYRTLARVTCYDRPNPYENRQAKVGDNDHNLVKPPIQRQIPR